jgi:hypothetical protein
MRLLWQACAGQMVCTAVAAANEWCLVSHDRLRLDKEFRRSCDKDMDGWLSHETVHRRAQGSRVHTFAAGP